MRTNRIFASVSSFSDSHEGSQAINLSWSASDLNVTINQRFIVFLSFFVCFAGGVIAADNMRQSAHGLFVNTFSNKKCRIVSDCQNG